MALALPTLTLLDDFARGSEKPLNEGGGKLWKAINGMVAGESTGSNNYAWDTGGAEEGAYWATPYFNPAIQAAITWGAWTAGAKMYLWAGLVNPGSSGWEGIRLTLEAEAETGKFVLRLHRRKSTGVFTLLTTEPEVTITSGGRVALSYREARIDMWSAGSPIASIINNPALGKGNVGIGTLGPTNNFRWDNIEAGEFSPFLVEYKAPTLTETTAVLQAVVNTVNLASEYTIQYGTSEAPEHGTTPVVLPPSEANKPLSPTLTGLSAGTKYFYRLVFLYDGGEEKAEAWQTFKIPGVPPAPIFRYYAYDFLHGIYLGELPLRGVSFSKQLNGAGTLSATLDLRDERVQGLNPLGVTSPNRTMIVVERAGAIVWAGISQPRKWDVDCSDSTTTGALGLQYVEPWAYFAARVQATDYSNPPFSGINGLENPMPLWNPPGGIGGPWFAPLIALQIFGDALIYSDSSTMPFGNPMGGVGLALNGQEPEPSQANLAPEDWLAVNYPYPSLQTVESIVTQLAGLGLGVGFDHALEVNYSDGPKSPLLATWAVEWPWRGYTGLSSHVPVCDVTSVRKYSFPEAGDQTANQVYEVGGGGAIYVKINEAPLLEDYPLLEKVMSRSSVQSQHIMSVLQLNAESDLTLLSYAPVTPTITLAGNDVNLPLGSYTTGTPIRVKIPKLGGDGQVYDPRFPNGMDQIWRITGYTVTPADEGDSVVQLNLAAPPLSLTQANQPLI